MKRLILLFPLLAGCGYFADENNALKTLDDLGFTDAKIEDRKVWFLQLRGCGRDDTVGFTVSAKNPKNKPVEMLVCCGTVFKSCTVRGN